MIILRFDCVIFRVVHVVSYCSESIAELIR